MKELNVTQMEQINGGDLACAVAMIGGTLLCGWVCGALGGVLLCSFR